MKNTKYNEVEKSLADNYLNRIEMGSTQTNMEIAYWDYEWYVDRNENHDSRLRGLLKSIHVEEMKRY